MDYKDFHDGLISLTLFIFIFSFTFMIGSIVLKPYVGLEPFDRDFIVILCIINIIFSIYFLIEGLRLEKVFSLEDEHIIRFGKRIGIVTLIYTPHLFFLLSLFARNLHNLQMMMVFLIIFMETLLIVVLYKEVYDLVYIEEAERRFQLDMNRKRYIEREKKPLPDVK